MTEKEQLIQAFKSLDFEALQNLLDDNRSYMDVSKDLFLSRLKKELDEYKKLITYEKVIEGTCGSCNKGCKAYKFKTDGCPSLNLFFEEKNGKVTDIYLCNGLKVDTPDENDWDIYFKFYEEEKVSFVHTLEFSINLQKIDNAIEDFNRLSASGLVSIQELVNWYDQHKSLADELNLNDPFVSLKYKAFEYIDSLYSKVSDLVHNYNENYLAKEALREYEKLNKDDEKMIVSWLLKHESKYFFSLKKTDNWEKTGILILETEPSLVVDCSDFLDSFLYNDIYYRHYDEIMTRYEPTKEHFEQNGGSVERSLESYLKLHNKYTDL